MFKIYVKKSAFGNGSEKKSDKKNFEKLKAEVIAILEKKDSEELKKAIEVFSKSEAHYTYLAKSDNGEWIEKAGYGVGTIRIWKGKKYKKISASPTRWVRVFDKEDRGAKSSMTRLINRVKNCKDENELYQFCMSNHALFQDENGVDLPIMDKLRAAIDIKKEKITGESENYGTYEGNGVTREKQNEFKTHDKITKEEADLHKVGRKLSQIPTSELKKEKDKYQRLVDNKTRNKVDHHNNFIFHDSYKQHLDAINAELEKRSAAKNTENKESEKYDDDAAFEEYKKLVTKENPTNEDHSRVGELVLEHFKHSDKSWPGGAKLRAENAEKKTPDSKVLSNGKTVKEVREKYGIKPKEDNKAYRGKLATQKQIEEATKIADKTTLKRDEMLKKPITKIQQYANSNVEDFDGGIDKFIEYMADMYSDGVTMDEVGKEFARLINHNVARQIWSDYENGELKINDDGYFVPNEESESEKHQNRSDAMKGNKNAYKGKEELQNDLLKLSKERSKILDQIKKLNNHKMELNQAKYSGVATDKDLAAIEEDLKDTESKIDELYGRNAEIERDGNKIAKDLTDLEDKEENNKKQDVKPAANKGFDSVVKKMDKIVTRLNRNNLKRSNYIINGEPMNIATDAVILVAQKGHDDSLEDGTIGSMERVYNVGNEPVSIPSGINEVIKNAPDTYDHNGDKMDSTVIVGDYLFNVKRLKMAQKVLGNLEDVKIVGDGNINHPVRMEKGDYSVVLMPTNKFNASEESVVNNPGGKKEKSEEKPKENLKNPSEMTDKELKDEKDKLNEQMLDNPDLHSELYPRWQQLHTELLDREHQKQIDDERKEIEKERAEKEQRKAERKAKVEKKEAAGTMIRKIGDAIGNENVEVNHSGSTLKVMDKDGHLLKMLRDVTKQGNFSPRQNWDLHEKAGKLGINTGSFRSKVLLKDGNYYVLDNSKLYTLEDYAKKDVKKSIFDDLLSDFSCELIDEDEEDSESDFNDYDASQPDLFNSTQYKVSEALDDIFCRC